MTELMESTLTLNEDIIYIIANFLNQRRDGALFWVNYLKHKRERARGSSIEGWNPNAMPSALFLLLGLTPLLMPT